MATLYDTTIEMNGVEYGICGIDVGNSRVKIHHDDVFLSFPYDKEWKKNVQHHFRDHTTRRYLIGLSSVNPKQTTAIVKVIQRCPGHLVVNAHSLLMRNEKLLSFGAVEHAGIDRLLGTIGAMNDVKPPLITVDCGTAVTINVISKERVFLGGMIFAGFTTQLFGLAKQTAAIPEMKFVAPADAIGINTQQCLMAGVTSSVVGGIAHAIRNIFATQFKGKPVPVVLTGGEASHVIERLGAESIEATYHQHMVTDGILSILASAPMIDVQDSVIGKILT
ncbi:MAG: type III pantothenate kinase ['Candidatus Kapabacteria' thiocyanatum]|nr:type III pantothenate kinase ['Candidatus Kapabacteria' thiocyanatum]